MSGNASSVRIKSKINYSYFSMCRQGIHPGLFQFDISLRAK
jgi:hypothetical protein